MRFVNLSGKRFGRLIAVEITDRGRFGAIWKCLCDCGNETIAWGYRLREGKKKSCGCLWSKCRDESDSDRLRGVLKEMGQRCRNPKNKSFKYYGARGIQICSEWSAFAPFKEWALSNGYQEGLTIDRIDNSGPYSPNNCRWIPLKENCRKQHRINKLAQSKTA